MNRDRGTTQSEAWMKWKTHTDSLRSALSSSAPAPASGEDGTQRCLIAQLVAMCMELYKEVFHSSSTPLHSDPNSFALACIAGKYCTPVEAAFMWIGGWRPTSAITLIFSTLGLHMDEGTLLPAAAGHSHCHSQQQLLSRINAPLLINRSLSTASSPPYSSAIQAFGLSDEELIAVESLRRKVLDLELHLSDELASLQMLFPDEGMAEALINIDTTRKGCELMESKVSQLAHLFSQANQLRLDILQDLVKLLDPIHSAVCCISAFELLHALKSLH